MIYKTRIAPTPSGYLHEGNLFNALLTWTLARRAGGTVLLRIDDLDSVRVRPEFVADIFRTLNALDIDWDEGPEGPDELASTWSQHHRLEAYRSAIKELLDEDLLFACNCSRSQIRDISGSLRYPGTCVDRGLTLDTPDVNLRIKDSSAAIPYAIIRQKNMLPSYMIASVVDDVLFGVTHIVRGQDLAPSSATQTSLAHRIPTLSTFCNVDIHHHPLIKGVEGEKLSKTGAPQRTQWGSDNRNMVEVLAKMRSDVEEYADSLA
jgi:glutamyl/glutaminyl-tRNA synthetase